MKRKKRQKDTLARYNKFPHLHRLYNTLSTTLPYLPCLGGCGVVFSGLNQRTDETARPCGGTGGDLRAGTWIVDLKSQARREGRRG